MSDTQSEFSAEKPSKKQIRSKSQAKSAKGNKQSKNLPLEKKGGKAAKKEKKEKPEKGNQKQPKKKKQSKTKNEAQDSSDAKATVFQYMEKQNRPYNLLNVFDNLHGKIKKPVLEIVLNELHQQGKLSCKQFGKNKVYFLNQDRLSVSKEAVDQLAISYNEMRANEQELSELYKKNMDDLKRLLTKKTISEIKETIAKTKQSIARLRAKKQKLMHLGSEKVDEKDVQKIEKEQIQLRKELNKRRKITKECLSVWSQITEKKISQIADIMGVQL